MRPSLLPSVILAFALIAAAAIITSGLHRLAASLDRPSTPNAVPASMSREPTTQPNSDTGTLLAADEPLRTGDIVEVSVNDLTAQGAMSTRLCRIGTNGKIRLWYVGDVPALGGGSDKLEQKIADAYREQQLLPRAVVAVTARRPTQ